uniref:Uncharacterized protein n=1 Tax=Steinernema glaseri TaxID=37863 RepID=A0A1I8A2D4_9BILA
MESLVCANRLIMRPSSLILSDAAAARRYPIEVLFQWYLTGGRKRTGRLSTILGARERMTSAVGETHPSRRPIDRLLLIYDASPGDEEDDSFNAFQGLKATITHVQLPPARC